MSGYGNDDYERGGRGDRNNDQYSDGNGRQSGGRGYGDGSGREDELRRQGGYPGGGNIPKGGSYGGGGGYGADDEDLRGAARHAEEHAGDSGDASIFSSVLGMLGQNKSDIKDSHLDESQAVRAHQQFFGSGSAPSQPADSSSLGSAAAMQALKMFSGGASGNSHANNSQNAFIGVAMAQASKLFDQQHAQGNVAPNASKESAVQQAGEMALKMYLKSQGGNAGGLMGLAAKFM